jgi:hypothetical protein
MPKSKFSGIGACRGIDAQFLEAIKYYYLSIFYSNPLLSLPIHNNSCVLFL